MSGSEPDAVMASVETVGDSVQSGCERRIAVPAGVDRRLAAMAASCSAALKSGSMASRPIEDVIREYDELEN